MPLIEFTFFTLVVLATGWLVASLVFSRMEIGLCEALGFSLLAGVGSLSFTVFLLSLAGITPRLQILIVLLLIWLIAIAMLRQKRRGIRIAPLCRPKMSWRTLLLVIPLVAMIFCVVAASVNALTYPLYEWDAFAIWFFKAKLLLHEPLLPPPEYFRTAAMSYSHRDYPLLVPSYIAGLWGAMGAANDRWGRAALLLPYVGLGLIFFAEAKRRASRCAARWLSAVFFCAPALPFWAASGDADVTLAAFYTAHLVYLARWLSTRQCSNLLAAAIFACCMWFTKHEGEVVALISCAIAVIVPMIKERRFRRDVLLFPACLAVILLPWHLWSWNLPHSAQRFPEHITLAVLTQDLPLVWPAVKAILVESLHWQSWGFLFPLLAICLVLTPKRVRHTETLVIWLIFLAQVGLYVMIDVLSLPYMKAAMAPTRLRFFVQMLPAVALLILFHWPEEKTVASQPLAA